MRIPISSNRPVRKYHLQHGFQRQLQSREPSIRTGSARKVLVLVLILAILIPQISGCASSADRKTEQLKTYREEMSDFLERFETLTRRIGSIDPADTPAANTSDTSVSDATVSDVSESSASDTSDSAASAASDTSASDAQTQFLDLIDQMADACSDAASLAVPAEYETAGSFCQDINNAMQQAKENYHKAFESSPFNEASFNEAQTEYQKAIQNIESLIEYFQTYGES